jgi:hypothetical protein
MESRHPHSAPNTATNDFQRAAAEAEAKVGTSTWFEMTPTEQIKAIYAALRRIDAVRAAAISFKPRPRGRFRVAGEATTKPAT